MSHPYCTACQTARIVVFYMGDGTTRCPSCIELAIREGMCEAFLGQGRGKTVTCELVYGHQGPHEAKAKRTVTG